VLRLEDDVPEPAAKDGGVVVRVSHASVNPLDTYLREGAYTPAGLPMIPGVDVAGDVEAVGDGVAEYAPGDRVFGTGLGRGLPGTFAEYVWCPVDRLAHLPDDVPLDVAGATGNVAVTAYDVLFDHAGLRPGETCLVHGGNGGVGHVAVQLANSFGATVVATARPAYHDQLRELGADVTLDYRRDDLGEAVVAATAGVDVVLDQHLDTYLQFDLDVGAPGVRIVSIGGRGGEVTDAAAARGKDATVSFTSLFNIPDLSPILDRLAGLLAAGDLRIEIARTYDLSEAAAAHQAVIGDSYLGKLGVTVR